MTFRNNKAAFIWGFSAVFIVIVAVMTFLLLRDGPPGGMSPLLAASLMGIFWLGGTGLCGYAAGRGCSQVTVRQDASIQILARYPLRRGTRTLEHSHCAAAQATESTDDEGTSYYYARVALADGTSINLYEGHDREACQSTCARFNAAAGLL